MPRIKAQPKSLSLFRAIMLGKLTSPNSGQHRGDSTPFSANFRPHSDMLSLRWFLLILLTLGCREAVGNEPVGPLASACLSTLGISLGFGLLFKACALRMLASKPRLADYASLWDRFHRTRCQFETLWLCALPAALLASDWLQWLNSLQAAGAPQTLALLGCFLPSLVVLLLVELTSAQFDELCRQDTDANIHWPKIWSLRLRLGEMASFITCITPLLLISLITDIANLVADVQDSSQIVLGSTGVALLLIVLFLPRWLGRWMGAERLPDGDLRERIQAMLVSLGIQGIEPRLIRSRGHWAGAAVVGWLPMFRQLWLGDALIARLTDQELDMVVMHELAHVTRRHFAWRLLPIVWALVVVAAICLFWHVAFGPIPNNHLGLARNLLAAIAASVVLVTGLGSMARACELDADRTACQLATQACAWTDRNPDQAALLLGGALSALLANYSAMSGPTWLHPSLQQRLRNILNNPSNSQPPYESSHC